MNGVFAGSEGGRRLRADDLDQALVSALAQQESIGIAILDKDLRVAHSKLEPGHFGGLTVRLGCPVEDLVPVNEARAITARLRRVLETGEPLLSHRQRMGRSGELVVMLSALPLPAADGSGGPGGLVVSFIGADAENRRLDLLLDAAARIGASLDVWETARELADVLVPTLGDRATVYLATNVFAGEEPPQRSARKLGLRCAAQAPADAEWPDDFIKPGMDVPPLPDTPTLQLHLHGTAYLLPDRQAISAALGHDPALLRLLMPPKSTGQIRSVLLARGQILGSVSVFRTGQSLPFSEDDVHLLGRSRPVPR